MQARLFIGLYLTPHRREHLLQKNLSELHTVQHEGKEYLGKSISVTKVSDLKNHISLLIALLAEQVPEWGLDETSFVVFPQLFFG